MDRMVALLLAETNSEVGGIVQEVENMCHAIGMGVIVHHAGDDLNEILDSVEGKVVVFSPRGELSLDELVNSYDQNVVLVVGGFTEEKELEQEIYERADATVSLGDGYLEIPEVVEEIIKKYEEKAKRRGG